MNKAEFKILVNEAAKIPRQPKVESDDWCEELHELQRLFRYYIEVIDLPKLEPGGPVGVRQIRIGGKGANKIGL